MKNASPVRTALRHRSAAACAVALVAGCGKGAGPAGGEHPSQQNRPPPDTVVLTTDGVGTLPGGSQISITVDGKPPTAENPVTVTVGYRRPLTFCSSKERLEYVAGIARSGMARTESGSQAHRRWKEILDNKTEELRVEARVAEIGAEAYVEELWGHLPTYAAASPSQLREMVEYFEDAYGYYLVYESREPYAGADYGPDVWSAANRKYTRFDDAFVGNVRRLEAFPEPGAGCPRS